MRNTLLLTALLLPSVALAAPPDVPDGAWYSATVNAFVDAGYFQSNTAFRAGDNATRAEFIELIVKLQGGVTQATNGQSFDDVSLNAMYYPSFEQTATAGWMKGAASCLGTHPCFAKPESPINRAEASAILQRAFGIHLQGSAPSFKDSPDGQWFTDGIRIAASNCILQGDAGATKVRPADSMNRAEMVIMLDRLKRGLIYPECTVSGRTYELPKAPDLTKSDAVSSSSASISSLDSTRACTVDDWTCSEWIECSSDGTQSRFCTPPSSSLCQIATWSPEPSWQQKCSYFDSLPKRMKDNMTKWQTLQEEMVEAGKALIPQGDAGKEGLRRINAEETKFVVQYNMYVKIYNEVIDLTSDQKLYWNKEASVSDIETAMRQIEKDFRAIPKIYY